MNVSHKNTTCVYSAFSSHFLCGFMIQRMMRKLTQNSPRVVGSRSLSRLKGNFAFVFVNVFHCADVCLLARVSSDLYVIRGREAGRKLSYRLSEVQVN